MSTLVLEKVISIKRTGMEEVTVWRLDFAVTRSPAAAALPDRTLRNLTVKVFRVLHLGLELLLVAPPHRIEHTLRPNVFVETLLDPRVQSRVVHLACRCDLFEILLAFSERGGASRVELLFRVSVAEREELFVDLIIVVQLGNPKQNPC